MITKDDYTIEGDCWIWKWGQNGRGYGKLRDGKRIVLAHRHAYAQMYGEPAFDLQVRHMCGTKLCVNPAHLEVGDQSDNEADKKVHGTARYYFQYCKWKNGKPLSQEVT